MELSASNLELIRTKPQSSTLCLSVFQPRVAMQCRVSDASVTRGARTIQYNSVSAGDFSAVEAGMTLLVGTTALGQDVGRIRIRSATSDHFVVSENSNIMWTDLLYLTVLRYWEVWPVFPRIIQDPADLEDVIFYKDYDIEYTDQNSILGTFIGMGPHRAAVLETGSVNLWYGSTGTLNLLGNPVSYEWSFEGGTPTGSTAATPGWVSYDTPGHYVTRLIVSASGTSDTSYRYVSIYDKPGEGNSPPVIKWSLDSLSGGRDEGGYSASIAIQEPVTVDDNSVVVIFSDDWYGNTHTSLGGNYPNAQKIFFVGYVDRGSIQYDYKSSKVTFDLVSITGLMKESFGFSVSVESKATPATWYELKDLDVRRAIYHYLKWHTTVLSVADFQFVGTYYAIQFFDADRTTMFDAIDNLMRGTLIGKTVADRQGKIWAEVNASAYDDPVASFPSTMLLEKRDWIGEPQITERFADEVSYIEMGGICYNGDTATGSSFSAHLACAPGAAPGFRGSIDTIEGLALGGQLHLNGLVGNQFADRNSKYPNVDLTPSSNFRNLDIAPQESVRYAVSAGDALRNVSINGLYIPDGMSWTYDSRNRLLLLSSLQLRANVNGDAGETLAMEEPDDDGWVVPPTPPFPPFPIFSGTIGIGTPIAIMKRHPANIMEENYLYSGRTERKLGDFAYTYPIDVSAYYRYPSLIVASPSDTLYVDVLLPGIYRITAIIGFRSLVNDTKIYIERAHSTDGNVGYEYMLSLIARSVLQWAHVSTVENITASTAFGVTVNSLANGVYVEVKSWTIELIQTDAQLYYSSGTASTGTV
jgi:hypothetical protein